MGGVGLAGDRSRLPTRASAGGCCQAPALSSRCTHAASHSRAGGLHSSPLAPCCILCRRPRVLGCSWKGHCRRVCLSAGAAASRAAPRTVPRDRYRLVLSQRRLDGNTRAPHSLMLAGPDQGPAQNVVCNGQTAPTSGVRPFSSLCIGDWTQGACCQATLGVGTARCRGARIHCQTATQPATGLPVCDAWTLGTGLASSASADLPLCRGCCCGCCVESDSHFDFRPPPLLGKGGRAQVHCTMQRCFDAFDTHPGRPARQAGRCKVRSRTRWFTMVADRISFRNSLRSSSTREPSDPLPAVVFSLVARWPG